MPAKSKHMERRKQRIANAKKNARLAGKLRRRRRLQALFGLLAILVLGTAGYLWQSGFFGSDESSQDPETDVPTAEVEDAPEPEPADGAGEDPAEGAEEDPADGSQESPDAEQTE